MDPTMPQAGAAQQQMTGMDPNQAMQNQMLLQALNGGAGGGLGQVPVSNINAMQNMPMSGSPPPMQNMPMTGSPPPTQPMAAPPVDPASMAGGLGSQNQMQGAGMQPGMSAAMMQALMSPVPGGQ